MYQEKSCQEEHSKAIISPMSHMPTTSSNPSFVSLWVKNVAENKKRVYGYSTNKNQEDLSSGLVCYLNKLLHIFHFQ